MDKFLYKAISLSKTNNFKTYTSEIWANFQYSRNKVKQGWKIHVSTNPSQLNFVLSKVVPVLFNLKVNFKIVRSYTALAELNKDIFQNSKVVTVYPVSDNQFKVIIRELQDVLGKLTGPRIITDRCVNEYSPVQYRYGSFTNYFINEYGQRIDFVYDKNGKIVLDKRDDEYNRPLWLKDPLGKNDLIKGRLENYKFLGFISKGSKLICLAKYYNTDQKVIIKQVKRFLENKDEVLYEKLIKHEYIMLKKLNGFLGTPVAVEIFEENRIVNLVTKANDSQSLNSYVETRYFTANPLSDTECKSLMVAAFNLIEGFHKHKCILGDVSPNNIVINADGNLSFVDFDYAYFEGEKWYRGNTYGFIPPTKIKKEYMRDNYSLAGLLFFIATGRSPFPKYSLPRVKRLLKLIRPTIADDVYNMMRDIIYSGNI